MMNREILFRGKRVDNGKWTYGSLSVYNDGSTEIRAPDENDMFYGHFVRPETVGQYIGLTDKNGQKIFEGDIIRGMGNRAMTDYFQIRWSAAICSFTAGEGKCVWPCLDQDTVAQYEVVGNIHDNPELLEVQG